MLLRPSRVVTLQCGGYCSAMLIAPDSRRIEPPADGPHYHVWRDHGLAQTIMTPRFGTNQAARQAALRAGMEKGTFSRSEVHPALPLHGEAGADSEAAEPV